MLKDYLQNKFTLYDLERMQLHGIFNHTGSYPSVTEIDRVSEKCHEEIERECVAWPNSFSPDDWALCDLKVQKLRHALTNVLDEAVFYKEEKETN